MSTRNSYPLRFTRPDGTTFTESFEGFPTATDALEAARKRGAPVRLATSPGALRVAARKVARDQAQSPWDEWIDAGFVMVAEACDAARNSLRLPEEPYVAGAYPLDDDGSDLATAYRQVLEATADELAAVTGPHASIRIPRPEWMKP